MFVVLALVACPRPAPAPVDPSEPVAGEGEPEEVTPGQTAPPDGGADDGLEDPLGDPLGDPVPGEDPGAETRTRGPVPDTDLPSSAAPEISPAPPAFEPKNAPLSV